MRPAFTSCETEQAEQNLFSLHEVPDVSVGFLESLQRKCFSILLQKKRGRKSARKRN